MEKLENLTILKHISYLFALVIGAGVDFEQITILAILLVVDTITGTMRAYVIHGGKHVTSQRLTIGVLNKLILLILPSLIALTGKGAGINLVPLAQGSMTMFMLSELYSVISNIYVVKTGKDIKEFDAISFILKGIQGTLQKLIK